MYVTPQGIHPVMLARLSEQHSLSGGLGFMSDAEPPLSTLDQEINGFLLRLKNPTSTEVAEFLKLYEPAARDSVGKALIARGVSAGAVGSALTFLNASNSWGINAKKIYGVLTVASAAVSGVHGYRRNDSIGWGLAWFVLGGIFPIVTPVIAVAQGYGRRKA